MNVLMLLYPGDDAVRLAASVAVQIAGVVLLALAVGWTVARRNAALRHGIWLAALTWVCIAPVAVWGLQRAGITMWRTAGWHFWPAKSVSAGSRTVMGSARPVAADQQNAVQTEQPRRPATPDGTGRVQRASHWPAPPEPQAADGTAIEVAFGALTAVWAAGAILLLARLVWGLRVVASIRRELVPFGDLPGDVADRLRRTLGVKALPPIMLSWRLGGPATIGLWRSIVVLPAEMAMAMSASELHDALAHECAHALRHDARIALVQQLMAAIYWLHPLVHVLNRQLARAREEICDNVVLSGTTAADYARSLLSLSQTIKAARGRIAEVQMFDKRCRLADRVEGLLNTRRIVMTQINRRAVALVAITALAFGTTLAAISAAGDQPEGAKPVPTPGLSPKSASVDPPITEPRKDSSETTTPRHFAALANGWELVDQAWIAASQQPRFEERKAELDVKEAKAAAESKKLEYQALSDAHAVPQLEVDRAKASVRVAEVHLEQVELELERAHLKVEQQLPGVFFAGPSLQNGQGTFFQQNLPEDPTVREVKVKDVIASNHPNLDKVGAMRVALVRFKGTIGKTISAADELKPTDGVLIRDLMDGTAKNEVVHRGDFVVVLAGDPKTASAPTNKPKETPKPQSDKEATIDGIGTLIINDDDDLPPVRAAGESDGTFAARWYIKRVDNAVTLTDDPKKAITQIIEAHSKNQKDLLEKNGEKLKRAQAVWMDAIKTQGQDAVAKAQKDCEDEMAPMLAAEKKEQQALGAVITTAQQAKLREHEIVTWLGWIVGQVKLSDEQRTKFRAALNEVKDIDYETWECTGGFVVEKILTEKILTLEQKRTIFKHDTMEAIKLNLPGADLTPEQMKKAEAAADEFVKDQIPKLDGASKAAAANKIADAVRILLTDEQKQKVQAALSAQSVGARR